MPAEAGYRTLFFSRPKEDGGGDLFDWTRAQDGSYLFTVGDIMGKGLQAKFYAFSFLSYIRSTIHAMLRTTVSPAALDEARQRDADPGPGARGDVRHPSCSCAGSRTTTAIVYANAGHCRPILVTPDGPGLVEYSDLILGLDPQTEYVDHAFDVPPGAALLCYTDGLNEQVTKSGAMMGEAGVSLAAQAALQTEAPVHTLLSWLLRRSAQPHFEDDVLVFWLQREAQAAAARAA